jgi:Bacterial regulatory helix-turn-helix protein, lysR family
VSSGAQAKENIVPAQCHGCFAKCYPGKQFLTTDDLTVAEIQQLRFLAAVAQNDLNITAAAAKLCTTQPAVSKQLMAPHIDRTLLDRAAACDSQDEVDALFANVELTAR